MRFGDGHRDDRNRVDDAFGQDHHYGLRHSEYTALLFSERCEQAAIEISMGSIGGCFDNAVGEAFHASPMRELINRSVAHNG